MTKLFSLTLRALRRSFKIALIALVFCACPVVLVSSKIPSTLEQVKTSGTLVVVSRNGPTTYYENPHGGYTGFEYSLAKRFAKYLGVKMEIREQEDLGKMLGELNTRDHVKNGHMAASGLTITSKRKKKVLFTTPYLQITQQLIYRAGDKRPRKIEDLYGKTILIIGNSSHAERMRELQRSHTKLQWQEGHELEMLDLLEMVHNGKIDHAVVDSNAYDINSSLYPKAQVAFDISEPQGLAWAFPKQKDKSLYREAQKFFEQVKQDNVIEDTVEKFYGHLGKFDYSGALLFARRIDSRLPKWIDKIKATASQEGLDWRLMAALSYQESHWNPSARSRTGVRGFMMLTRETAKEMGVANRIDAAQSIIGGTKYFKKLHGRIAKRIAEPDRTWMALASYNVGLGHLEDARILTQQQGGNPDKWVDVREWLPMLAKRKYYKHSKHGYTRGWEAVDYVHNIRKFHKIIAWHEMEKSRLQQLASIEKDKQEKKAFASVSPTIAEAVKSIATSSL